MIAVQPSLSRSQSCERDRENTCRRTTPGRSWVWCDGCRRDAAVARIGFWLRHSGGPEVLSLTCYDEAGGGGAPDRRYDPVAAEADLERVMAQLPKLERTACELSKGLHREERGWFAVVNESLRRHVGPQWVAWQDWVFDQTPRAEDGSFDVKPRPFDALLDRAADMMADALGPDWW